MSIQQKERDYLIDLVSELSRLYGFARQMNELDFVMSLGGEFRGMQDAGWSTTITAAEVREELNAYLEKAEDLSVSDYRVVLLLYSQLSEAGGVYESVKNIMGIITSAPYNLWPFQKLVRVRKSPSTVIGPNANKTFRDLAKNAKEIGMTRLSDLLGNAFRDDIRNSIAHADYIIWFDGLRLRHRNGGAVYRVDHAAVFEAITRGINFFDILQDHNRESYKLYNKPKEIVGKLSNNFPMPWTVYADPEKRAFSVKGSSPGPVTSPAYLRQIEINARLGGRVLAAFAREHNIKDEEIIRMIEIAGYEPNVFLLNPRNFFELEQQINKHSMNDERRPKGDGLLVASPFGFTCLSEASELHEIMPGNMVNIIFD